MIRRNEDLKLDMLIRSLEKPRVITGVDSSCLNKIVIRLYYPCFFLSFFRSWTQVSIVASLAQKVLPGFAQLVVLATTLSWGSGLAHAHKPSYADGNNGTMEDAHFVSDIDISMVLYKENTCDSPQTWLSFTTTVADATLFVQLGMPQLDRMMNRRPSIAVMAAGLPAQGELLEPVPFTVPQGLGIRVFDTSEVERGREFFELFTGTKSWIMHESHLAVPQAGTGYVVAWFPDETEGKLWVAIGETEDFTEDDFAMASYWIEKTQTFHEEDFVRRGQDDLCLPADEPGGCQAFPQEINVYFLAMLLLFMARRHKRCS